MPSSISQASQLTVFRFSLYTFWMTGLPCSRKLSPTLAAICLAVGSVGLGGQSAIAEGTINSDSNTGPVQVSPEAFDIETIASRIDSNFVLAVDIIDRASECQSRRWPRPRPR